MWDYIYPETLTGEEVNPEEVLVTYSFVWKSFPSPCSSWVRSNSRHWPAISWDTDYTVIKTTEAKHGIH